MNDLEKKLLIDIFSEAGIPAVLKGDRLIIASAQGEGDWTDVSIVGTKLWFDKYCSGLNTDLADPNLKNNMKKIAKARIFCASFSNCDKCPGQQ